MLGNTSVVTLRAGRRNMHHWTAFMILSSVLVIIFPQAKFLRCASIATETISVRKEVHVFVILKPTKWRRGAMCSRLSSSCELASSIEVVRSTVRSKSRTCVGGVEQPIRSQSGARDRDCNIRQLKRRLQVAGIPMSFRTSQLLCSARKRSLA